MSHNRGGDDCILVDHGRSKFEFNHLQSKISEWSAERLLLLGSINNYRDRSNKLSNDQIP